MSKNKKNMFFFNVGPFGLWRIRGLELLVGSSPPGPRLYVKESFDIYDCNYSESLLLLIAEILHHLNPAKKWDKLPTSTG